MNPVRETATRVFASQPIAFADFRADYWDSFRIRSVGDDRTAREWARNSLSDGTLTRIVWHGLLGFNLAAPGTRDTLVGWHIRIDTPAQFALETDGWLMSARMVFTASDKDVVWTTMLHYHRPAAQGVWAAAGHAHRALVPRCLTSARAALLRNECETNRRASATFDGPASSPHHGEEPDI
jgi:hypothetical protein